MNSELYETTKKNKNKLIGVSTAIAIPALVIFLFFCIVPFIMTFVYSLKNFTLRKGIINSPWVGFENFNMFFESPYAINILQNTFIINILSIIFGGIYVLLLTYGIANIKRLWIKIITTCIVILPTLIPIPILIRAIMDTGILVNPSLYRLSVVANEVFCIAPIAILAGSFACMGKFNMKKVWFITFGYIAVRTMILFSSDVNFLNTSNNPLVYSTGDVIDALIYRQGILEMMISDISVAYIVKIALQIIPLIIGIVAVIMMSKKMQKNNEQNIETLAVKKIAVLPTILAIIPAAFFVWVLFKTQAGINVFEHPDVIRALINSLFFSGVSCVLVAVLSMSLAYAMVVDNKVILILNSVFMMLGGNIIGQYIQMKSLGLGNTYLYLIIINSLYSCIGAYFIYFAVGGINKFSFKEFFVKSIPILVTIVGVGFARFYGAFMEPLIYLRGDAFYPVSLILKYILRIGGENDCFIITFSTIVLLLIPVIIGVSSVIIAFILMHKQNNKAT